MKNLFSYARIHFQSIYRHKACWDHSYAASTATSMQRRHLNTVEMGLVVVTLVKIRTCCVQNVSLPE